MNNDTSNKNKALNKKRFEMPDGMVILIFLILVVTILTYIIPAGQFERIVVDGKTIVKGDSFKYIEQSPVSAFDFFKSIPLGMQSAAQLIIMVLLIGGSIRLFDSTGAIRAAIFNLKNFIGEKNSSLILVAMILFFGCLGAFPGMYEASIPFAPLCIGISLALGYDVLVGICISLVAIVAGFSAGVTNPWTTGIGQSIAQLPMFSGLGYRMIAFIVFMSVLIFFVLTYAKKVKNDPKASLVYGMNFDHLSNQDINTDVEFTTRLKLVLVTFACMIIAVVYGSLKLKWGMTEMSAVYVIGSIIGGIIAGYNANKIVNEILEGCKAILIGAIAIGIARAISVVMDQGHITDTIVHSLASLLQGHSNIINAIEMYIMQNVLNFLVPSGSGQALITLPVMIPVGDLIGVNRQITILAFQFGNGLTNLIFPTDGALLAFLAYTKIPFPKWLKFIAKFMLMICLAAIILITVAVVIGIS